MLYSGFCVTKGITEIKAKGIYAVSLIKKCCYCQKVVPGDLIDTLFEVKEAGDVGMIEGKTEDNKLFKIFCMKEPDYLMKIMVS